MTRHVPHIFEHFEFQPGSIPGPADISAMYLHGCLVLHFMQDGYRRVLDIDKACSIINRGRKVTIKDFT